jgi:hypothetical protein
MDAVAGLVAVTAERDQVLVRVTPGGQLVARAGASMVLPVVDLKSIPRTTVAAGMAIPVQDRFPLPPPFRMQEQFQVVAVVEFHSLGPLMGQRETTPVQAICTDEMTSHCTGTMKAEESQ